MTVHWGLEAHPMVIPRTDFDLMTSYSVPGPLAKKDASKAKAEKLRQYLIPQALNEPLSRKAEEQHYIRIYAAIVCPTLVFAVVDFSRLVRLFITSRDRPWTADDFEVSSVVRFFTIPSQAFSNVCRAGARLFGDHSTVAQTGILSVRLRFATSTYGEPKCSVDGALMQPYTNLWATTRTNPLQDLAVI